ncbi:threonine synthase [Nocardioides sp. CF8]|nr:threonine synthase [Nocardioides sp. CF8]
MAALATDEHTGMTEGTLSKRLRGRVLCNNRHVEILLLIYPGATFAPGRNWHRFRDFPQSEKEVRGGCRDFVGPFPQSLVMRALG